jgi:hypothetical protein
MFVNRFHYSVLDFDLLTPVQAHQILTDCSEIEQYKQEFLQSELRNISFFIIKSSMGDTKHVKVPKDLYKLASEQYHTETFKLEITENDRKILNRLLSQYN